MKTKNNTQEKVKGQVKMMVLRGSVVIFSLVLISLTSVSAQDFWNQFLTESSYGKMAIQLVEQSSGNENTDIAINGIEVESTIQIEAGMNNLKYNAQEFIDAEMALEIENRKNSTAETNNEAIEVESALQIETLMNNMEYNAKDFVDAEMAIESRINSTVETNNEAIEVESAFQIEAGMNNLKYNAQDFVDAEMTKEIESRINNNSETNNEAVEAELTSQIEAMVNNSEYKAEKFVDDEIAKEIESHKNEEKFFDVAEVLTASGVNQEIVKYAQKQIILEENRNGKQAGNQLNAHSVDKEPALEIENCMTTVDFLKSAELTTAMGADQEIGKYAQKQRIQQHNKKGKRTTEF